MTKPTRTTNRLHFTDLSHTRFEDLAMQLVYRLHRWEQIHHDGRAGSDDGVDIRAVERLDDESLRQWFVQCRRYKKASAATFKKAVDDALEKAKQPPDVLLTVVACDVSMKARADYESYATEKGVETPQLWAASTLETRLYSDHRDLLFAFFGISLARQERSRETSVKRNLAMKRRLAKVFTPGFKDQRWDIIVHSVDDDSYPRIVPPPAGHASGWFKVEFCGFYYNGVEVYLRVEPAVMERATGRWALIKYSLAEEVDKERFDTFNVFHVGRIPYRNIIEVDEEGDEYDYDPHLYCSFVGGEPYEDFIFRTTKDKYTLEKELQRPRIRTKLPAALKPKGAETRL
jgi:Restriction endonuclease